MTAGVDFVSCTDVRSSLYGVGGMDEAAMKLKPWSSSSAVFALMRETRSSSSILTFSVPIRDTVIAPILTIIVDQHHFLTFTLLLLNIHQPRSVSTRLFDGMVAIVSFQATPGLPSGVHIFLTGPPDGPMTTHETRSSPGSQHLVPGHLLIRIIQHVPYSTLRRTHRQFDDLRVTPELENQPNTLWSFHRVRKWPFNFTAQSHIGVVDPAIVYSDAKLLALLRLLESFFPVFGVTLDLSGQEKKGGLLDDAFHHRVRFLRYSHNADIDISPVKQGGLDGIPNWHLHTECNPNHGVARHGIGFQREALL
ncbi:hypothetical protein ACRALDRAFT_1095057 [Sodiomyces alcalophilus JCM 7366]|uniref:uncharacterized protein n=1 Tax=Sodiomyces alcalophilus JCM 7366 TaxID=591952 RepID=UPI0039B6CFFD